MLVLLDDHRVGDSQEVFISFAPGEYRCATGTDTGPADLTAGVRLSFVRVGDDAEASSPPYIGARDVRADCR